MMVRKVRKIRVLKGSSLRPNNRHAIGNQRIRTTKKPILILQPAAQHGMHLTPLARPQTWARLFQLPSVPRLVSPQKPPAAQVMLTLGRFRQIKGEFMPRYVAFLRGVSPMNAKMPELKRAFEAAGFTDVKTVLSSGNVAFSARTTSETALARQAESAMDKYLDHSFYTIVRSSKALCELVEADPFAAFDLPAKAKRVVTFLGKSQNAKLSLPIESDGAQILAMDRQAVFTAYAPSSRGAVFMRLIEKTFGSEVTTRTWETVKKCAIA